MTEDYRSLSICEAELKKIEEQITDYESRISYLSQQRYALMCKRGEIDMSIILDCIEDNGLTSEDMLDLICIAGEQKKEKLANTADAT